MSCPTCPPAEPDPPRTLARFPLPCRWDTLMTMVNAVYVTPNDDRSGLDVCGGELVVELIDDGDGSPQLELRWYSESRTDLI